MDLRVYRVHLDLETRSGNPWVAPAPNGCVGMPLDTSGERLVSITGGLSIFVKPQDAAAFSKHLRSCADELHKGVMNNLGDRIEEQQIELADDEDD